MKAWEVVDRRVGDKKVAIRNVNRGGWGSRQPQLSGFTRKSLHQVANNSWDTLLNQVSMWANS